MEKVLSITFKESGEIVMNFEQFTIQELLLCCKLIEINAESKLIKGFVKAEEAKTQDEVVAEDN